MNPGLLIRCYHSRRAVVAALIAIVLGHALIGGEASPGKPRATIISISNGQWRLNGELPYRGTKAEGLLMNVRMVNATFEDRNRPNFDADANTAEFIARIPDYVAQGVRAFTLNLQGGMPGYEGAVNSAFEPDGTLRPRISPALSASSKRATVTASQ